MIESLSKPEEKEKISYYDTLIVLGKNIGIGSSKKDIQKAEYHLSQESIFNVQATGRYCFEHPEVTRIIFVTGKTAGEHIPSEAEAMEMLFKREFPEIATRVRMIREENSINTRENAQQVGLLLKNLPVKNAALLSVGYHVPAALAYFNKFHVTLGGTIASEDILYGFDPRRSAIYEGREQVYPYEKELLAWENSSRVTWEKRKELVRRLIMRLDKHDWIPSLLTLHRKKR